MHNLFSISIKQMSQHMAQNIFRILKQKMSSRSKAVAVKRNSTASMLVRANWDGSSSCCGTSVGQWVTQQQLLWHFCWTVGDTTAAVVALLLDSGWHNIQITTHTKQGNVQFYSQTKCGVQLHNSTASPSPSPHNRTHNYSFTSDGSLSASCRPHHHLPLQAALAHVLQTKQQNTFSEFSSLTLSQQNKHQILQHWKVGHYDDSMNLMKL
jgi:hypothetical protein